MFPMAAALMHHALEQAAGRFGDRDAMRAGDRRWSFRDLDNLSSGFAGYLIGRGIVPGDRVALMTSNRPEFVVAVHGVSKAGAAAVLLSPRWKALEVAGALRLNHPFHALADGEGAGLLRTRLDGAVLDLDDEAVRTGPAFD